LVPFLTRCVARERSRFEYTFPADGEYRVTISDLDFGLYPRRVENETTAVVPIDRKEVFREEVGGEADRAFVDRGGGAPAGAKLMQRFANIPVQVIGHFFRCCSGSVRSLRNTG
jgi:hypothetical protein